MVNKAHLEINEREKERKNGTYSCLGIAGGPGSRWCDWRAAFCHCTTWILASAAEPCTAMKPTHVTDWCIQIHQYSNQSESNKKTKIDKQNNVLKPNVQLVSAWASSLERRRRAGGRSKSCVGASCSAARRLGGWCHSPTVAGQRLHLAKWFYQTLMKTKIKKIFVKIEKK